MFVVPSALSPIMKSVLLAGVVLLLRLYIGFLDLVAYCIVLLLVRLEKLNPSPAQNHVPPASTVEKTPDFVDGVMNGETPDDAPLSTLPGHSNELSLPPTAATPLLHPFSADVTLATSGSIPPTYLAKESSHRKPKGYNNAGISGDTLLGMGFLGLSADDGRPWSSPIASHEVRYHGLRDIVPCWDRDDGINEGFTCLVTTNPHLNITEDILTEVGRRAKILIDRFESQGNASWLQRAIHILDHVVALPHQSDALLVDSLCLQGVLRFLLFQKIEDVTILNLAIDGFQVGLCHLSPNATSRYQKLFDMGKMFHTRYEKKRDPEDLNQAIEAFQQSLELWRGDTRQQLELTARGLGVAFWQRFEIKGDLLDVERAIGHFDRVLPLLVDGDDPLRQEVLGNLGAALVAQCRRTGNVVDVERAIGHLQEVLSSPTSENYSKNLNNLAIAFDTRFLVSGSGSDLEGAIHHHQEALFLRNADHPDRPNTLDNLATVLLLRYKRTGDNSDLRQAIDHLEEATRLFKPEHPRRPACFDHLAATLSERYYTSRDIADLRRAIRLYEEALSIWPNNHRDRSGTLGNLGVTLMQLFGVSGNKPDLDKALDCLVESLSSLPDDHPQRQLALSNTITTLFLTPQDSFTPDTLALLLDRSIQLAKFTPLQHPHYSHMTSLIAPVLNQTHLDTCQLRIAIGCDPNTTPLDATLALLEKGSNASTSSSIHQLSATCNWIQLSRRAGRPCTLEMYARMFDLLDLCIARGCSLDTRRAQLSRDEDIVRAKGLVSEAVAFAIEQGATETAVEFLERGQSILLLNYLGIGPPPPWNPSRPTHWKTQFLGVISNRLRVEWEVIVQEIRALNGFEHFLRPMPFAVLQQAAKEGPVIFININILRSDAIVVMSDRAPLVVPLPFATPDQIERNLVPSFKAVAKSRSEKKTHYSLKSLWDTIVEPIVAELQDILQLPKNSRIWWCPTNPIMTVPLHAAGHYPRVNECLPSLYVSSYTSTLSALIRAREARHHYDGLPSALLVGQPNTPGRTELPEVRQEINRIKKRMPHATEIMNEHGTHDAVLSAVVQHQWVHLACHGHVRSDNPLYSHFSLHDGPLHLLEIMQQRLPYAELAFLSACHSASGDSDTADEFLHLAAGMQFAGFKSVVGTMWAMVDAAGPLLADEFYRKILPKGGEVDYTMAGRALNGATKKLWKDKVPLAIWINFVHWGA